MGSSLSFAQQVSVTAHGRGTMPGFNSILTSSEIDSIIRYVQGLGGPGTATTTTVPPGGEDGAQIYTRLCAACHGANGAGGSGGPINDSSFHGADLALVITDGIGTMPGFRAQLDDNQLALLVAYVEGLGSGPTDEGTTDDGSLLAGLRNGVGDGGTPGADPHAALDGESAAGGEELAAQLLEASPAPIGNPLGWTLAFAIAAFLVAVGSAITGALPQETEDQV